MSQEPDPTADFPEIATEAATPDQQRRAVDRSLEAEDPGAVPPIPGYTLQRMLGAGTFGQVWAGIQDRTGLEVAVKIFARDTGLDWLYFRHEVERLRRVSEHPYVVTLLDADLTHDPPYFVMPLLPDSLAHRRRTQGRPDNGLAARWIEQMAEALHYTHGKGLLHCDLKPNNIMVDQEGRVRVADFGQSMSRGAHGETTLGTLGTMAPEQAQLVADSLPDVAWDIYGLGATAYWLLTGELPRVSRQDLDELNAIGDPRQRLQAYRDKIGKLPLKPIEGVDQDLADIVQGCLHPDPIARTRTAADVLEDFRRRKTLQPLLCRYPWSAGYRLQRFLRRHAVPVALSAALLVGLGWSFADVVQSRNQAVTANARSQDLLGRLEFDQAVTLADGGQQQQSALWYARAASRHPGDPTYLLPLRQWPVQLVDYRDLGDSIEARALFTASYQVIWRRHRDITILNDGGAPAGPPIPEQLESLPEMALSGDGRWLAVGNHRSGNVAAGVRIYRVASAEKVAELTDVPYAPGSLQFSSDDRRLLVQFDDRVRVINPENGAELFRHPATTGVAAISEDGNLLAFTDGPRVVLAGPASPPRELELRDPVGLHFVGGGRLLASVSRQGEVVAWDVASGRAFPETIEAGHAVTRALLSPDGKLLLLMGERAASLVNLTDARKVKTFSIGHISDSGPGGLIAFSPDSGRIVISQPTTGVGGQAVDAVQIFRTSDGEPLGLPISFLSPLFDISFGRDGKRLFAADMQGMKVYDLANMLADKSVQTLQGAVNTADWPTLLDSRLAVCQELGEVRVLELATGKELCRWKNEARLRSCLVSSDGETLLPVYAEATSLQPVSSRTGQPVGKPAQSGQPIESVSITEDGQRYVTGASDGTVQVWNLDGGPSGPPLTHDYPVLTLDFDSTGRFLYSQGGGRQVRIWDLSTGKAVVDFSGSLAVFGTFEGRTVVAMANNFMSRAGDRPFIKTLGLPGLEPVGPPIQLMALQVMIAFRPGYRELFVPNRDGSGRLWDPVTALPVGRELFAEQLFWAVFDDRGEWMAITSLGPDVARVWDLVSGRPLTRQDQLESPAQNESVFRTAVFTRDRDRLLVKSLNRERQSWLTVYDLTVDRDLSPEILRLRAETWTGLRLDDQGGLLQLTEGQWRQGRERLQALEKERSARRP